MMVHPYFLSQATAALQRASANPDADPTAIAAWAEAAKSAGWERRGLIVDADGRIVAETVSTPGGMRPGRTDVVYEPIGPGVPEFAAEKSGLDGLIVDLAMARLSRHYGRPLVHLSYADVCLGRSQRQLSVSDVATRAGISESTLRAYLARGQMPDPDGRIGRTPWWWDSTIDRWRGTR